FQARYARVLESIDELLRKKAPTRADLDRLTQKIPNNPVARGHFFSQLQSPDWLEPLRNAGFFRRPAQPLEDPEKGTAQLVAWRESGYLVRVSKERPETVLEIMLEAESTKNARVHIDFLEAAKNLPAE